MREQGLFFPRVGTHGDLGQSRWGRTILRPSFPLPLWGSIEALPLTRAQTLWSTCGHCITMRVAAADLFMSRVSPCSVLPLATQHPLCPPLQHCFPSAKLPTRALQLYMDLLTPPSLPDTYPHSSQLGFPLSFHQLQAPLLRRPIGIVSCEVSPLSCWMVPFSSV